jgi:hypothetical protein
MADDILRFPEGVHEDDIIGTGPAVCQSPEIGKTELLARPTTYQLRVR